MKARAVWVAVAISAVASMSSVAGSADKLPSLAASLRLDLTVRPSSRSARHSVELHATLSNLTTQPVAVRPDELFRYLEWDAAPVDPNGFGAGGGLIGDQVPGSPPTQAVLLRPGAPMHRSLRWNPREAGIPPASPTVRLSIQYCNWVPGRVGVTPVLEGCVSSNEVTVSVTDSESSK